MSYGSNISNKFNLITTAKKPSHNLKVTKIIKNILEKKGKILPLLIQEKTRIPKKKIMPIIKPILLIIFKEQKKYILIT